MNRSHPDGWLFHLEESVKKQEMIAAIQACAKELGRAPTIPELMKQYGIERPEIRRHFGNYKLALEECGLEVPGWGRTVEPEMRFFFQAEDGIRDHCVTGVQTCALPI